MSTISVLFIVSIVSSVRSQFFEIFGNSELIPNRFSNNGGNIRPNYQDDIEYNNIPSSPCPDSFQYQKSNNEIQGLITVHGEVQGTIFIKLNLSVAVELYSVSLKKNLETKPLLILTTTHW